MYVAKTHATGKKVAIKEMDLSNQPRKELIVNEILVMKESQHPNIVNFLDAYLIRNNELWVVMEYMEGGALTDIIENNTLEEDQISSICLEVSFLGYNTNVKQGAHDARFRRARVLDTCTASQLSIVISSPITFCWMLRVTSRSVRTFCVSASSS